MNAPLPPIESEEGLRTVRKPLPHDSAVKHVQGSAVYIDDILDRIFSRFCIGK